MIYRLLAIAAAIVAIALLVASVANGADRTQIGEAGPSDVPEAITIELPESAAEVAVESSAKGLETANAAIEAARERAFERELPATADDHAVRALPEVLGVKDTVIRGMPETPPGWGCGDTDRTHTGPPGRPEADAPTGCTR